MQPRTYSSANEKQFTDKVNQQGKKTACKILKNGWSPVAKCYSPLLFTGGLVLSQKGTAMSLSLCTTLYTLNTEIGTHREKIKRSSLTKTAMLLVSQKQLGSLTSYWGMLFTLLPFCTEGTAVSIPCSLTEQIVSFTIPAASPSGIKASLMKTPGALRDKAACPYPTWTVGTLFHPCTFEINLLS